MPQIDRHRRRGLRFKRPDAAGNAKARKVGIVTGVNSRAIRGELDQRFAFARTVSRYTKEYEAHCGDDSVVLRDLIHSAATLKTVRNMALDRLMKRGPFDDADEALAAYRAFRVADSDLREVLRALPLKKVEKQEDLPTYLHRTYGKKRGEEDDPQK
jgi:hypothetical protein